jgi:hypothetical protein
MRTKGTNDNDTAVIYNHNNHCINSWNHTVVTKHIRKKTLTIKNIKQQYLTYERWHDPNWKCIYIYTYRICIICIFLLGVWFTIISKGYTLIYPPFIPGLWRGTFWIARMTSYTRGYHKIREEWGKRISIHPSFHSSMNTSMFVCTVYSMFIYIYDYNRLYIIIY